MARNLISMIDGTMVSASQMAGYDSYSNVFELACLLQIADNSPDHAPQIVFYTSGISSQPDNSSIYNLVTGNSIKSQIIDQYTNICTNFDFDSAASGQPDRIYLFGFSRGAMAVRALAGLIAEFGLLEPRDIRHLPVILNRWEQRSGRASVPQTIRLLPVEIEFVGVFDSVMGGIEWLSLFNPIRFKDGLIPIRCKRAIQIIAIDENRRFFKHKPWEGYVSSRLAPATPDPSRFLRQIWMPGTHSDVGGIGSPLWGQAALLAMTFYIRRLTHLRLNCGEIHEREQNLRESLNGEVLYIRPHKGPLANFRRTPKNSYDHCDYHHPVNKLILSIKYSHKSEFNWKEEVLDPYFGKISVDNDLEQYFNNILD